LKNAGCLVNTSGSDWHTAGDLSPPTINIRQDQHPSSNATIPTHNSAAQSGHILADLISELEDNLDKARAPHVSDVYARPSTDIWKQHRNRLDIPHDEHSRIANAYKQIDHWQDIVASGLSPKIGNMPLDIIFNDLRNQLPGIITALKPLETLS